MVSPLSGERRRTARFSAMPAFCLLVAGCAGLVDDLCSRYQRTSSNPLTREDRGSRACHAFVPFAATLIEVREGASSTWRRGGCRIPLSGGRSTLDALPGTAASPRTAR